jgi:hypothetical protein
MRGQLRGALIALALMIGLTTAAVAQQRPKVAIIPTQYFSATEQGADNVTQALVEAFARPGYTVIPMDRGQTTFRMMGLDRSQDFGDPTILRFGRRLGADLVVHPQLLAVGIPAARGSSLDIIFPPAAVLHVRVLNARTGKGIYSRQISYPFGGERPRTDAFGLPPLTASAAVDAVTRNYFERVAGSRQEYRRMR